MKNKIFFILIIMSLCISGCKNYPCLSLSDFDIVENTTSKHLRAGDHSDLFKEKYSQYELNVLYYDEDSNTTHPISVDGIDFSRIGIVTISTIFDNESPISINHFISKHKIKDRNVSKWLHENKSYADKHDVTCKILIFHFDNYKIIDINSTDVSFNYQIN